MKNENQTILDGEEYKILFGVLIDKNIKLNKIIKLQEYKIKHLELGIKKDEQSK